MRGISILSDILSARCSATNFRRVLECIIHKTIDRHVFKNKSWGLDDGAGCVDDDLAGLGNNFFESDRPSAAHGGSVLTELDVTPALILVRFGVIMNGAAVTFASS